jgi:hypothetical protein
MRMTFGSLQEPVASGQLLGRWAFHILREDMFTR